MTFDRPMDRESVTSRVRIEPAVPGCNPTDCPFTWNNQTLIWKHPGHEFVPATKYQVMIRSGFRDQAGRINPLDHAWDFTIVEALALRSSIPANAATAVPPEADISLQFSRDLVQPSSGQVRFEPQVPFRLALNPTDPTRLTISPTRLLEPRTQYRLTLDAAIEDAHHDTLQRHLTVTFTTGPVDLSRALAFAVLDADGTATRVAMVRPPATVNSPAPSLRVLYSGQSTIAEFGWSGDRRRLYVLEAGTGGRVQRVSLEGGVETLSLNAAGISMSPTRDELAYVDLSGALHLWIPPDPTRSGAPATEIPLPQAGRLLQAPAWSGDGRRLALVVAGADAASGPSLAVLERATLTVFTVPAVAVAAGTPVPLAWSFDGTALAFPRSGGGGTEIWTYRPLVASGNGLARAGAATPSTLAWSDDGSILYAEVDAGIERAPGRVVPGQPGDFALLPTTRAGDAQPVTPGFDRRVAFLRAGGGTPQLWLMNNDGTGVQQLTFPTYHRPENLPMYGVTMPRWAPR